MLKVSEVAIGAGGGAAAAAALELPSPEVAGAPIAHGPAQLFHLATVGGAILGAGV